MAVVPGAWSMLCNTSCCSSARVCVTNLCWVVDSLMPLLNSLLLWVETDPCFSTVPRPCGLANPLHPSFFYASAQSSALLYQATANSFPLFVSHWCLLSWLVAITTFPTRTQFPPCVWVHSSSSPLLHRPNPPLQIQPLSPLFEDAGFAQALFFRWSFTLYLLK